MVILVKGGVGMARENERHTYEGWKLHGRQVCAGARRGPDGKFGHEQTKAAGGQRGKKVCATCGGRINYGVYCGKCEFSR